jgi:hypothetical protein
VVQNAEARDEVKAPVRERHRAVERGLLPLDGLAADARALKLIGGFEDRDPVNPVDDREELIAVGRADPEHASESSLRQAHPAQSRQSSPYSRGTARGLGGQRPLIAHFGGVSPSTTYTLRVYFVGGVQTFTVTTTIPGLFTAVEAASGPAVVVVRWREVAGDE